MICLYATPPRVSALGSVVNISSIGNQLGRDSSTVYAASKGVVNTLTLTLTLTLALALALARALAPQIRVNAIAPGMVRDGLPCPVLQPQHMKSLKPPCGHAANTAATDRHRPTIDARTRSRTIRSERRRGSHSSSLTPARAVGSAADGEPV